MVHRSITGAFSEADIDRAFHRIPKGDAWRACTLQSVIDDGRRIWLYCAGCQQSNYLDASAWAEKHDVALDTPMLLLSRRIRCTRCGWRKVRATSEPYSIERDGQAKD